MYSSGIVYYGDELRPGGGNTGGSFFTFVPTNPRAATPTSAIISLDQSPLVTGSICGLHVGTTDNGEGSQWGVASWTHLTDQSNADLRALALANKLTGYYRPEDIEIDKAARAQGSARFCGTNTGNELNLWYGEA